MKKEENINEDKGQNERFSSSSKWRKRRILRILKIEDKGQNGRFFVKMEKEENINKDKGQTGRFFVKMKKEENID